MRVEAARIIPHPVSDVWEFVAVHHVENHPRWDPDIRLERTSEGPLAVGSSIRRHSTRRGRQSGSV